MARTIRTHTTEDRRTATILAADGELDIYVMPRGLAIQLQQGAGLRSVSLSLTVREARAAQHALGSLLRIASNAKRPQS